jgi:uncharacterized protein (DUF1499 family)
MDLFMNACFYHSLVVCMPLLLTACAAAPDPAAMHPAGRIGPCPDSPNCVSTLATDPARQMAPLPYRGDRANSQALVLSIVSSMPRAVLMGQEDHFLQYEFRSRLFGFVDDVVFFFDDETERIHFRSAARSGYWDMGVNRKRMAAIGKAYRSAAAGGVAGSPPDAEESRR